MIQISQSTVNSYWQLDVSKVTVKSDSKNFTVNTFYSKKKQPSVNAVIAFTIKLL